MYPGQLRESMSINADCGFVVVVDYGGACGWLVDGSGHGHTTMMCLFLELPAVVI